MFLKPRTFLIAAALLSGLGGCVSQDAPGPAAMPPSLESEAMAAPAPVPVPAEQRVTIDNFAFDPPVLTISPGTRVTWLNRDDVPHTATSSDLPPAFESKAIDTDETFSHVFARPGTYTYFCAVHPHMTATVIVK